MFEDVRHERNVVLLSSLTDADIVRQSKFNNHEADIMNNLVLEKLHRQHILKEHVAMSSLESQLEKKIKIEGITHKYEYTLVYLQE